MNPENPKTRKTPTTSSASPKLAVIGAGSVGASVAYAAMLRGSARTIALYDVNTEKVDAEVLDLAHGSSLARGATIIGGDDISVVRDSDVIVVTAGARQKPGQSRLDLAGTNVDILRSLMPQLLEQAPHAVFVLVTNPADVLAYAAAQIAGLPQGRVMSSGTVLDTSRLRWLLATRLEVSARSVHATIVGEHGDTEFGLWSAATVGQVPLTEWRGEDGEPVLDRDALRALEKEVAGAAYSVIQGKGATNLAIGVSGARIVEAIVRDEHAVLPVSTPLNGWHGIDDVAMSMPTIVGRDGATRRLDVLMDDSELERMHASARAMRTVQADLGL